MVGGWVVAALVEGELLEAVQDSCNCITYPCIPREPHRGRSRSRSSVGAVELLDPGLKQNVVRIGKSSVHGGGAAVVTAH